ncbi:MAG: Gfo/Idh/MocA family oxidoreductase [Thermomicrobiales bacterium]
MAPEIRCALVGLSAIAAAPLAPSLTGGRWALPYSHASALARIPGARLVAACDLDPARLEAFVQTWGATWPGLRTYRDAGEMLASGGIDALGVCTPDDRHAEIVVAAAERGVRAILCEKPLATSLADADRMVAAVEAHSVVFAVDHTRRWDPFYARAKELIDAGRIGRVRSVNAVIHGERAMLYRNGTHALDLLCWYAGAAPVRVFARLDPPDFAASGYRGDGGHDPASEPGASAYVEFANGVRGHFNGIKGRVGFTEWDVLGDAGRIRIGPGLAELWTLDEQTGDLVLRPFPATMLMTGGIQAAWEELFAALVGGGAVRSTVHDGRQVVALIEAILASHRAGGLADVPGAPGPPGANAAPKAPSQMGETG